MDWNLLDEFDAIAEWGEQSKNVESTKWSERKEALEGLIQIVQKNPRLSTATMTIYGELMDNLRKILKTDSNAAVVMAALKVVTLVADGLREKFSCFVSMIIPHVLEKSKDKKQPMRDLVGSALDSIGATCEPTKIMKDVVEHLQKPSPQTKHCVSAFLYRFFKKFKAPPSEFLKATVPLLVKLSSDSDLQVRETACEAIGSAKRLLGDAITVFLQPINNDKKKLEKIDEACIKATEEWTKEMAASAGFTSLAVRSMDEKENSESCGMVLEEAPSATIDPWSLKDPQDVASKLPSNWNELITSKKWQERKEAVDQVANELSTEPRIMISEPLAEIISSHIKVIGGDLNVNVAAVAARNIGGFAKGMREDFAQYAPKVLACCFERLKEKKPALRDSLVSMADSVSLTTVLSSYVEATIAAMGNKNPQIRAQTCLFLSCLLLKHDRTTFPTADIKMTSSAIQKCCSDGDSEVRENALRIVAAILRILGEGSVSALFPEVAAEKLKMTKVEEFLKTINESEETPKVVNAQIKKLYENCEAPKVIPAAKSVPPSAKSTPASARPAPASRSRPTTARVVTRPTMPSSARPVPKPSVRSERPSTAAPSATRPRMTAPPTVPRPATSRPIQQRPLTSSVKRTPAPPQSTSATKSSIPGRLAAVRAPTAVTRSTPTVSKPVLPNRFGFTGAQKASNPLPDNSATRTNSARPTGIPSALPRPGSRPASRPPSRPSSALGMMQSDA